jgi:hypothetical protein
MAYTTAEGRRELLDRLTGAVELIGSALAELGEAYELVDEDAGDRLEEALFRPAQAAYGAARRAHSEFAQRYGFAARRSGQPAVTGRPRDARGMIERAADALGEADQAIADLQDSMLPVEVGDPEIRSGLASVRGLLSGLPERADALVRTLGR